MQRHQISLNQLMVYVLIAALLTYIAKMHYELYWKRRPPIEIIPAAPR